MKTSGDEQVEYIRIPQRSLSQGLTRSSLLATLALVLWVNTGQAQPDYTNALWNPAYPGHWYTTGNAHAFCVIHDMEGYYLSTISYFQQSGTQASAHFCVNGLKDNANDSPAGEITQMVREEYWAWHVRCWNRYMFGTEHEGFVSNPAWYTEAQYQASAALQRHLCDVWNIPKDRNHIVGHNEWQNATWVSWMRTNWPAIDPTCNDHTDPGQYWDWAHFMSLITNFVTAPTITSQPQNLTVDPGSTAIFTVVALGTPPPDYQWRFNTTNIVGATNATLTLTNVQPARAGAYSVVLTNSAGSVISSNAILAVSTGPSIITQPQNLTIAIGQGATFSVVAGGSAPLIYQWKFNGGNIPGATASSYAIAAVKVSDSGAYSVLVTNHLGTLLSSNGLLFAVQLAGVGDNSFGQLNVAPDATNFVAIAAGDWHSLGLRSDGTVSGWGNNGNGQCIPPAGLSNAVAISAGGYHSLAIRMDGTLSTWGASDYGQASVPAGLKNIIGIAAGTWHSLALRRDGTVSAWGDNTWGQAVSPGGLSNFVAIAAGGNHNLALRDDGTVVAWGENTDADGAIVGESTVPEGLSNVVAVAAGSYHSLALKSDGSIVAWGDNSQGQASVPAELAGVVAIAAGGAHSLALRADGTVASWGADWSGQCDLPAGLTNVVAIGAGIYQTLALVDNATLTPRLFGAAWRAGRFSVVLQTLNRKGYILEMAASANGPTWTALPAVSGNGALRVLADPSAAIPQRFYRVRQQ